MDTTLPLPDLASRIRPATPESLAAYFGTDRVEACLSGVVAACWLWDGSLFLDRGKHTVTLPADPKQATRAVLPLLVTQVEAEEAEHALPLAA